MVATSPSHGHRKPRAFRGARGLPKSLAAIQEPPRRSRGEPAEACLCDGVATWSAEQRSISPKQARTQALNAANSTMLCYWNRFRSAEWFCGFG